MPSSTPWRTALFLYDHRPHSPLRPTAFERLSPDPYPHPSTVDGYHGQQSHDEPANGLYGLGVSYNAAHHAGNGLNASAPLPMDTHAQAHPGKTTFLSNGYHRNSNGHGAHEWYPSNSTRPHYGSRGKVHGHTRSGSTIDDLASAAIAYSPTFASGSPLMHSSRPATSHISGYSFSNGERATKRIKSENLHANEWTRPEQRPASSHIDDVQALEDAQLLLSMLAQPSTKPSPLPTFFAAHQTSTVAETAPPAQLVKLVEEDDHILPEVHHTPSPLTETQQNGIIPSPSPHEDDSDVRMDQPLPLAIDETGEPIPSVHLDLPHVELDGDEQTEPPKDVKKQRRVKPENQQSCCVVCQRLQADTAAVDDDFAHSWISCNACKRWFHSVCVGFKDKRDVQSVDKFICTDCEHVHGPTTYVRKSSRPRTAIDYANLNQGVVKSSSETAQHHYIQPIKDGALVFQPDDFPRVRPELVTAETFEKSNGWKRPFVVPAEWNPRFGVWTTDDADPMPEVATEAALSSDGDSVMISTDHTRDEEEVFDCDQDYLDMVMPRGLTVRMVSELYGPDAPVPVIDVKSQQSYSDKKWNLKRWADYYESVGDKPVRNVISLEVSESLVGKLIRRPRVVRDLDIQDAVWPATDKERKSVGFYCLMSVADSYTDFHIDFGGSSVYYHILKGRKTFFFIPPEDKNLKKYEDWCNSDTQDTTFLGDLTGECTRVDLYPGDTAFIPAGWIHAVWTPEDSLVIGGNFLTRLNYELQIKVANVERDTKVPGKFRYPYFQKVMWYTLIRYLEDDPVPEELLQEFYDDEHHVHLRAHPVWQEVDEFASIAEPGSCDYHARYYSRAEVEGLLALRDYLHRTALIASDYPFPDMKKETVKAVQKSIPKGYGEPLELVKRFGVWCAWKMGNVTAPEWCRPDAEELAIIAERAKAKKVETYKAPPERMSSRVASLANISVTINRRVEAPEVEPPVTPVKVSEPEPVPSETLPPQPAGSTKSGGSGPKRLACDECRKRRIKCRHRERDGSDRTASPELTRPRSYSNISEDVFRSSSVASLSGAVAEGASSLEQPTDLTVTHNANTCVSANLAQAALAHISDPSALRATDMDNLTGNSSITGSKKGRAKACEECRKSKRRCVHDEHGHVDPAKAAEPTKPRGSISTKRPARPSDEHLAPNTKRTKLEEDSEYGDGRRDDEFDGVIDPMLIDQAPQLLQPAADAIRQSMLEMTDPGRQQALPDDTEENLAFSPPPFLAPVADAPSDVGVHGTLESPDVAIKEEAISIVQPTENQTPMKSLASPPDSTGQDTDVEAGSLDQTEPVTAVQHTASIDSTTIALDTPSSGSRHSSRQPRTVDRFVPETFKAKAESRTAPEAGRHTSGSGLSQTPEMKEKSFPSNISGSAGAQSQSAHQSPIALHEPDKQRGSRDSSSVLSEHDADERLARELQATENGLRRRSTRS